MPISHVAPAAAAPADRLTLGSTSVRSEGAGTAGYCSAWWGCTPFASDDEA